MSWWLGKAQTLQRSVRADEAEVSSEHSSRHIRQAIVHGREDIVLLVSLLDTVNNQLLYLRWMVATLIVVLVFIALKLFGYF